jgi:hypothetical protein
MATDNPDGYHSVPGGAEIWAAPDGYWYVVYRVPNTNTPLGWRIDTNEEVAAIFGPDKPWKPNRTLSKSEWNNAGLLLFGTSRQLANASEHPFDAFVSMYESEARTQPWLKDPEILALNIRAILEARQITPGELSGTKWWKTHNETERQWLHLNSMDPKTAKQRIRDGRDAVRKMMVDSGISNPIDSLVNRVADWWTTGSWSDQYLQTQIGELADPYKSGKMDGRLWNFMKDLDKGGYKLDTMADNTAKVEQLLHTWLGPAFSSGWTDKMRQDAAGKLRQNPSYEEEFVKKLQAQRSSLFSEYDPSLSYDDIAAPWRSVWNQMWGETPDEADPLFVKVVKLNDMGAAQSILRQEGLKRRNSTVTKQALEGVGAAFGDGVRGAI